MRQNLSQKNVDKLSRKLNLDIEKVMVRGGTEHRKDLCLSDGTITYLYADGELEKTNRRWRL